MKAVLLGTFFLLAFGAVVNAVTSSDETSSAATSSSTADYGSDVSSDADRGIELTDEGLEITQRLVDWSTGGTTDPATACGSVSTAENNIARLDEIVDELSGLDTVSADNVAEMRSTHATLVRSVEDVARLCAEAGF